jgi:hypothetical protein
LVIGQQHPLLAQLAQQIALEIDDSPLDHAAQDGQQLLPRLQNEAHGRLQVLKVCAFGSLSIAMPPAKQLNSVVADPR